MVVDDDPAVREVLRDMVAALGHETTALGSGDAALEAHAPGRFDLILTDLGMPGMNGWKLAELIRARDPIVVITFVTGWGEDVDATAMRKAGVALVVAKPFSIEDVVRATELAAERVRRKAA
jgi:CheY-like chemotaxis protein